MPSAPLVSFDVRTVDADFDRALTELRKADKNLYNQMRREFRKEIKPFAQELQRGIPRGGSPLSGMSRSPRIAKTRKSPEQRSPFVWKLPSTRVDIGTKFSRRRGVKNVVRISFTDKRPFSAFSVLETARDGASYRGRNMVRGIKKKYPNRGRGRWVIPQFYEKRPEIIRTGTRIVAKYTAVVNRRLARKLRRA